jgi:hypothetical protein
MGVSHYLQSLKKAQKTDANERKDARLRTKQK